MNKWAVATLSCIMSGWISTSTAATILYQDFSDTTGLTLNGVTAALTPNADGNLRLTNNTSQSGSAFSTNAIQLNNDASFSTAFNFNISKPINGGADGLTFALQTVSNTAGGGGGGIGYAGIPNSVAIEFDTWNNGSVDGNSASHVGINLNGDINSVARADVYPYLDANYSNDWFAWVDYDGVADLLEVRLAQVDLRPQLAILSYTVDLAAVLGSTFGYAGFTSGTGWAGAQHDIIDWQFESSYKPIDNVGVPVPLPASLSLFLVGLLGLQMARRRNKINHA